MNSAFRFVSFLAALWLAAGDVLAQQSCPAGYPLSTPDSDFADAGSGTVRHIPTGLVWKRCAEGQTWDGTTCQGSAAGYTWQQAFQRADAVNAGAPATWNGGFSDWRVPNVKELHSIVERGCSNPSINLTQFPATPAPGFWSASPWAGGLDGAHCLAFDYGNPCWGPRNFALQVRLVRAGQCFYNFDAAALQAPVSGAAVPTLSAWSLVLLALALTGVAALRRRC